MDTFLEIVVQSKLTPVEMKSLNRPISTEEIKKLEKQSSLKKKNTSLEWNSFKLKKDNPNAFYSITE